MCYFTLFESVMCVCLRNLCEMPHYVCIEINKRNRTAYARLVECARHHQINVSAQNYAHSCHTAAAAATNTPTIPNMLVCKIVHSLERRIH